MVLQGKGKMMVKEMTNEESAKLDEVIESVYLSIMPDRLKNWLWYDDGNKGTAGEVWAIFYPVLGDPNRYSHIGEFCARLDKVLIDDEARSRG